jgi:hypothetical protein
VDRAGGTGRLGGGAVLTCLAGARTDSAYPRFARGHLAADVIVYPPFLAGEAGVDFSQLARLPEVVAAAALKGFNTGGPIAVVPVGGYGSGPPVRPRPYRGSRPQLVNWRDVNGRRPHRGDHLCNQFDSPAWDPPAVRLELGRPRFQSRQQQRRWWQRSVHSDHLGPQH